MKARLNRLFAADGRCFDVAVDHGFFGEASFLGGIEDMEKTVDTLVEAAPDAIQLSLGQAPLLQSHPGPKPALVLRTDVANVYGPEHPGQMFSELAASAVEHALVLDAACVVVNLLQVPGEPERVLDGAVDDLAEEPARVNGPVDVRDIGSHNERRLGARS